MPREGELPIGTQGLSVRELVEHNERFYGEGSEGVEVVLGEFTVVL
jgi:hypothetical protein